MNAKLLVFALSAVICAFSLTAVHAQTPALIAARGSFYRSVSSSVVIPNGGNLVFNVLASETNTVYFSLNTATGEVTFKEAGTYVIMADAPFTGEAQMRFDLNETAVVDTVVGQGASGTLSSYTIVVVTKNTRLRWINCSGHSNTLPASVTGSYKAHLTILGIDGVTGSTSLPAYAELRLESQEIIGYINWVLGESKSMTFSTITRALDLGIGRKYLVLYQLAPTASLAAFQSQYPGLNASRGAIYTQLSGKALITGEFADLLLFFSEDVAQQLPYLGGSSQVFNSLIVLDVTDMAAGSFGSETGPHVLISGNRIPLDSCDSCTAGAISVNAVDNTWSYGTSGIYWIGVTFDVSGPAQCVTVRGTSEAASSHSMTPAAFNQISSVHVTTGASTMANSVVAKNSFTADQAAYGRITVVALRIG